MYKVFVHNKPVEIIGLKDPIQTIENTLVLKFTEIGDWDLLNSFFKSVPTAEKAILLCENPDNVFEALKKNFAL